MNLEPLNLQFIVWYVSQCAVTTPSFTDKKHSPSKEKVSSKPKECSNKIIISLSTCKLFCTIHTHTHTQQKLSLYLLIHLKNSKLMWKTYRDRKYTENGW